MSWAIWVSAAASVVLAAVTAWALVTRRNAPAAEVLASVGETRTTLIWTALLLVMAVFVWAAKLQDPTVAGTDDSSWYFVAGLGLVCAAGACFTLLFTLVKRVYATEEGIWSVDWLGRVTSMPWDDVRSVTPNQLSKAVKVEGADGSVIAVNGGSKAFAAFSEVARAHTPRRRGASQLADIERRLERGGKR